jgi:epoxyqueuosine reductase
MTYLASDYHIHARQDPATLFPQLKSIIVIAVPYSNPASISKPTASLRGRIAAYAWNRDYHFSMTDVFDQVVGELKEKLDFDFSWRGFTDSAPILERQMGVQAGLGWIGKNGCLIQPKGGSYFLLAEIFTDIPPQKLEECGIDSNPEPVPDRCGTCTRCIDACPTGCIQPDRMIDAGRCISYLTIENKGSIPRELREKVGDWVFGCDVCQMVCPWNKINPAVPDEIRNFFIDPYPDLVSQLGMADMEFKEKFHDSPVLRAKRRGWLRNVCVALGNMVDIQAVEPLLRVLREEPEALIRLHAAWALGRIATPDALLGLKNAYESDVDDLVKEECFLALNENG